MAQPNPRDIQTLERNGAGTMGWNTVMDMTMYRKMAEKPRLDVYDVDRFRWEIAQNANWRRESMIDEDYYDGNQYSNDALSDLEDIGIKPVVMNLIGPTVDVCLGMEAKSRSDWTVKAADDPQWDDVALAMASKMHVAERLSRADHACSEALKRMFKGGIAWVEVGRETDPHLYRYRVKHRDWREFGLDPYCQENDLSDARYLKRSKFFDRVALEAMFPEHAANLSIIGPGWRGPGGGFDGRELDEAPMYRRSGNGDWRDYSLTELEWIDADRDRLMLDEVWYRVYVRGEVLRLSDGTTMTFNPNSQIQVAAVERGRAVLSKQVWTEMRVAMFVGPLRLQDIPSPYAHRRFPYMPFWGMREGRTGVPYGLVRRMRPMQDEVNARNSKMLWALSSRRVIAYDDAVEDHDVVREEIARPDAYIRLGKQWNQNSKFEVDDNRGISEQQYKILVDRVQRIQDVAGVYQTSLGKKETGADSGIAINSLIEQGTTTLAPMYENFRMGRTGVGELLMSLVVEDLKDMREVDVQVTGARGKRVVTLNKPKMLDSGIEVLENDVQKAKLRLTLEDVPATATFRQQQFTRIAEMVSTLGKVDPSSAVKFLDLLVEASDVPNKHTFLERIRDLIGIAPDPSTMSEEQKAEFAAKAQKAAEMQALEERALQAEVAGKEAKAQKDIASIEQMQAKTNEIMSQIEARFQELMAKVAKTQADTAAVLQDIQMQAEAGLPQKSEAVYRW